MSTLHVTFTPQITGTGLDLGTPALRSDDPTLVSRWSAPPATADHELTAPEGTTIQFRIAGFRDAAGQPRTITASSRLAPGDWRRWAQEGADAHAVIDGEGPLGLTVAAVPAGSTQGATTTTVTIRINKGGRPDDLLQQFAPG